MSTRRTVNNALTTTDGTWVWTGLKWAPVSPHPGPKPNPLTTTRIAASATPADALAGRRWVALVHEHGSVDAVHHHLGQTEAQGRKQMVKTYGDHDAYTADIEHMHAKGWRVSDQSQSGQQSSIGRTAAGAAIGGIMTGGIGAVVGGMIGNSATKKGTVTVVWERD